MPQAWLWRHDAVLVPCEAIAGDAEGLNDVGADCLVPGHMLRRVRVSPHSRRRKTVGASLTPIEINIISFDRVGGLLRRNSRACDG